MDISHNKSVRDSYSQRASTYDDTNGGWHVKLGQDFVSWLSPQPGETAIDLACGTGLVTVPLAERLGSAGRVVAVDLTPEMIQVGKERLSSMQDLGSTRDIAPVTWLTADIASEAFLSDPVVTEVIDRDGGFDIVSVCSALVLLPDQKAALQFWVNTLMKKGGRIILDVPTEDMTLQLLMTNHLPVALGLADNLSRGRLWVKDRQSLPQLFQNAGLVVERDITTDSYTAVTRYEADDESGLKVLEDQLTRQYPDIARSGKAVEARRVWPELWKRAASSRSGANDSVYDEHRLYVCIGRKL